MKISVCALGASVLVAMISPAAADCSVGKPGPGAEVGGHRYVISETRLSPTGEVDAAIALLYGPDAKMAVWQDLKADLPDRDAMVRFFNEVGIRSQGSDHSCDNYFVQVNGAQPPAGMRFFIARHDGAVPPNWALLDSIGNKTLNLGRWNYPAQVLIQMPGKSAPAPSVAAQPAPTPQPVQAAEAPQAQSPDLSWPVGSWGSPGACARSRTDSSQYPNVFNVTTDAVVDVTAKSIHWFMPEDLEGGAPCSIRKSTPKGPGEWSVVLSCTAEESRFTQNAVIRRMGPDRLVITTKDSGAVSRGRCGTVQPAAASAPAALNEPPPNRMGACSTTTIKAISTRLQDTPGSGSAVAYANGAFQVGYEDLPAVRRSRPGDPVKLCVVEVDTTCKKGDPRAFIFAATNLRTGGRWKLGPSSHVCSGA
ncbi:hypothetical protein [uncultured Alsobacter sp.]|uniref:hypothetical protein n=1 Tax=uncultured Alsobacter sp. TaxID=1748258 RepID=UPI0025E998B7|nr:hypothetical protein [uncultured Alsobacter sp.]